MTMAENMGGQNPQEPTHYVVTTTVAAASPESAVALARAGLADRWTATAAPTTNWVEIDSICPKAPAEAHGHKWWLTEEGYTRMTRLHFGDDVITASTDGVADFGENGDGEQYLTCMTCLARADVPEGVEIDFS